LQPKSKVEHPVASSYVTQSRSIAEKLNFIGGEIQRQENKSNLQRPKIQLRERVKENILHPKDFNYVTLREVNPIDSSKHLQASLNCPPGFKEDSLNPNSQDFSMINPTTRPKALSQMNSARQALANPKQPLYFRHGQPKTETEIHHPSSKNFIQEFKENINSGELRVT
jgi:hypothetical protein